jgi:hypothetical protein
MKTYEWQAEYEAEVEGSKTKGEVTGGIIDAPDTEDVLDVCESVRQIVREHFNVSYNTAIHVHLSRIDARPDPATGCAHVWVTDNTCRRCGAPSL